MYQECELRSGAVLLRKKELEVPSGTVLLCTRSVNYVQGPFSSVPGITFVGPLKSTGHFRSWTREITDTSRSERIHFLVFLLNSK